jgi:DNA-binding transcriptional ArsR family regulator
MYQKETYTKNRKEILLALFQQPMDFTALRDETKLSEPTLSRHLKDLLNSGYVELKKDGRRRIYKPTQKALETNPLLMQLVGFQSAFRILRCNRNVWQSIGEETIKLATLSSDALAAFVSIILRYFPQLPPEGVSGKAIFNEIVSKMTSDFSSLEKMKEAIDGVEMRGGSAELIRKKFQEKLDRLTSIYLSLGPPFSYMWKDMTEVMEK